MHEDEQDLLSALEGWHWDDSKSKWLDPELCAKARREEVEYHGGANDYLNNSKIILICNRTNTKLPGK